MDLCEEEYWRSNAEAGRAGRMRQAFSLQTGIGAMIPGRWPVLVQTNSAGGILVFKCPADKGALAAAWFERMPTVFDHTGWSYLYNSSANGNDDVSGLYNKKEADVIHPARMILSNDNSFNCF